MLAFVPHFIGCSANKWGPPDCFGVCDRCYNGGVCDDQTGDCVCAPGFAGPNCLTGKTEIDICLLLTFLRIVNKRASSLSKWPVLSSNSDLTWYIYSFWKALFSKILWWCLCCCDFAICHQDLIGAHYFPTETHPRLSADSINRHYTSFAKYNKGAVTARNIVDPVFFGTILLRSKTWVLAKSTKLTVCSTGVFRNIP